MKTKLPTSIKTIEQAKSFLTELHDNSEAFHPEDDAHDIQWAYDEPTDSEKDKLNSLMDDIYAFDGFCPCGFLISLSRKNMDEFETL